jgi:competence protein ComEC
MKHFSFWLILLFLVVLRLVLFYAAKPRYPDGTKLKIAGRVVSEPLTYEYSQRVYLKGFKFYLPTYPEVNYGDILTVEGVVTGKELENIKNVQLSESKNIFFSLRKKLINFYERSLPNPHSALIQGVTIGSKKNITSSFYEILKNTGTLHVVVASGMNVTLVAGFLMETLVMFLKRKKAIVVALIGVWFYAVFSGFDAPIIRAAIMGSVGYTAQQLGKVYFAWRGLVFSAIAMLLINPSWIFDLGFILSFMATASLMLFEKRVEKFLSFVPKVLRQDLSTSLSAQVAVAPILFVSFGQFNLFSPIINALVLWTIAPITIIGMIAGFLGFLFEPIARLVLYLAYPLTSWFVFVVQTLG